MEKDEKRIDKNGRVVDSSELQNNQINDTVEVNQGETVSTVEANDEIISVVENEPVGMVSYEKDNNIEQKKASKKSFIMIWLIVALLIIIIVLVVILLNRGTKNDSKKNGVSNTDKPIVDKPSTEEKEETIVEIPSIEDGKKIIKEYGAKLVIYVRDHISIGNDVETIKPSEMETLLTGYKVKCEVFELNNNGDVKLDKCSINGSYYIYSFKKTYSDDGSDDSADTICSIKSKNGKINFVYTGYEVLPENGEDDDYEEHTIKCEEESCILKQVYDRYAVVQEKSGKSIVYDIYNKKNKVYTVLAGYDVKIMGRNYGDDEVKAFALTLRNPKKQEALYSLNKNKMVIDYGVYKYDWFPFMGDYVEVDEYISVYANEKHGLIDADTFEVIIEPKEYDKIDFLYYNDKMYVHKGKYMGVVSYNKNKKVLSTIIKPDKYEKIFIAEEFISAKQGNKYAAFSLDGKTQYLNGKLYDGIAIAEVEKNRALVLDGEKIKLLDLKGNLIKELATVPTGAKLYTMYDNHYDEEEDENFAWLVLTNPSYDSKVSDKYYSCTTACDDDDCGCDEYHVESKIYECLVYGYNFTYGGLTKIYEWCD